MPDLNGESASIIPSLAPSIGDTIRYQQQRADQNQWRKDQMQLREDQLRSQKEARRLQLVNHIESSVDPAKYLIGESTIDQHTTGQLEDVKSKAFKYLQQNPDADPTDVALMINNSVTPIAIAHAKQKAISDDIDKNLALAKADLPILNDGKLREEARKRAFLKMGPDGTLVYKDPEEMNSTNHVQDVINNHPELVVDNSRPFIKNIQSFKTNDVSNNVGAQYAGVTVKNSYNAKISPFRDLDIDAHGKVNGLKYKREKVQLPDGNSLDVVPEEEFQLATDEPNAKLAFYSLWNANKKKYGAGNLDNNDPSSLILQRKFMLDLLKDTNADPSHFSHDRQQTNSKSVNDVQAGYGTPIEQYQDKEDIRQKDKIDMENIKQGHRSENIDHHLKNSKILKTTPKAGTLNSNKYGI